MGARRVFRALRFEAVETRTGRFEAISDRGGRVPARGLMAARRDLLGGVPVYPLARPDRHQRGQDVRVGRKPFLKAA